MAGRPQFAGLVEPPIGAVGLHAAPAPALHYADGHEHRASRGGDGCSVCDDLFFAFAAAFDAARPMTIETCTGCGKPTHPTESDDNGACINCGGTVAP